MLTVKTSKSRYNDLKKIKKHFQDISNQYAQSGYFDGEQHPTIDMSLATLALVHENGSEHIPSRQLFAKASASLVTGGMTKVDVDIKRLVKQVGKISPNIDLVGADITKFIRNMFGDTSILLENAPLTIKLKGGRNTPLVDTGELRDNLGYKTSKNKGVTK